MSVDEARLDALARAISDGQPVDWEDAEAGTHDDGEHARVLALHEVARIAEFSRALQRSGSAAAPAQRAPEPATWGDLLLLEPVGSGASGRVWRAWDPRLRREVALKLLLAPGGEGTAPAAALLEEARALARVRHAHVVAVHGIAEHDGRPGLWMEYLHGATLADEIARRGALPADEVARIGEQLARALEAVHAVGLVHRDLKPANVVLEPGGRAVLADFGLGVRPALAESEPLRISGTPLFMAPERLAGGPATPLSDLYALGVTLWCALAGRAPFEARTVAELRAAARAGARRPLERPDAPPALVEAITRAMAPDPEARFANAGAFAGALAAAATTGPIGARVARPRRAVPALVGAGLIAAVALAVWLAPRSAPRRAPAAGPAAVGTPAPESAPYDVEARLVRRSHGTYERLATGDRVAPGDRLSLEFSASRPTWVYVLDEDERGAAFLLFPQPRFDLANPIPAGGTRVLPGAIGGRENAWTVTSRGGREHVLVVASPAPVAAIEAELGRLPAASPGRPIEYAKVSAPTMEVLRGVGGIAPLQQPATPRRAGALERFEALAGRETGVRGIWVRSVTLENPLR